MMKRKKREKKTVSESADAKPHSPAVTYYTDFRQVSSTMLREKEWMLSKEMIPSLVRGRDGFGSFPLASKEDHGTR